MDDLLSIDPRTADPNKLDPRVSYDTKEDKWLLETSDETFEYNTVLSKWIPTSLTDESNMTDAQREIMEKKKEKLKEMKENKPEKKMKNTAVYVSGLPLDCDALELKQVFSKYGLLAEDLLTGKPKIKLYDDDKGNFKGDALVVYMKQESVDLAIQMLDETKLRVGDDAIKVSKAEFKSDPSPRTDKRPLSEEDKKLIKKKFKQMNDKVQDWHGDDDSINPKWARTMVLRRVFTLEEIEDQQEKEDIIEDIKEGCEEFGPVERIILFDQEEDGVVLVRFHDAATTTRSIEKMDGRFFGGRKLIASVYNGESFQKSDNAHSKVKHDDEDDDHKRLNAYIAQNSDN